MHFFFFKQKTAYDRRISDGSSDVCSSDLQFRQLGIEPGQRPILGLKSTVHFRGDFTDIAHEILTVESPGAFIERAETLPYKHLRAGIRLFPQGDRKSVV